MQQDIPGTILFDGEQAQKGFALNRMCFSFNNADNRAAFLRDEDARAEEGDAKPPGELSQWQRYVQVLLLSNEFMYVD